MLSDAETYLNELQVGDPTLSQNKTNEFKVEQPTLNRNQTIKLKVEDSTLNQNLVNGLTLNQNCRRVTSIQHEVGETALSEVARCDSENSPVFEAKREWEGRILPLPPKKILYTNIFPSTRRFRVSNPLS